MNWTRANIDWAGNTDTAIARARGTTRQNVSAARKRLGAPASPAGHGGARRGGGDASKLKAACQLCARLTAKAAAGKAVKYINEKVGDVRRKVVSDEQVKAAKKRLTINGRKKNKGQ